MSANWSTPHWWASIGVSRSPFHRCRTPLNGRHSRTRARRCFQVSARSIPRHAIRSDRKDLAMRILVVGAGAIGGYFGGRLLEAGRDVTFLVGPRRQAQLGKTGLVIRSRVGDASLPAPPIVTADALRAPVDLVLLSCKAYDLEG